MENSDIRLSFIPPYTATEQEPPLASNGVSAEFSLPANKRYRPIEIGPDDEFSIWGVVSYAIKKI